MKHIRYSVLGTVFLIFSVCSVLIPAKSELFAQTKSPAEFLGYELGDRFTPHHQIVSYYEHVAATRSNVTLEYYGKTNELRPLLVAFVTSDANMARLDEIRLNNLRLTGLEEGTPVVEGAPAVTWLSYGIHGNESSSAEAAMQTLYELSDPDNSRTQGWLESNVVIMDPLLNPDGRDRYAIWYNQMLGRFVNPHLETREHNEPWPGGRPNHYYFDLNRDWAWQTQVESKARAKIYHSWMPHIHADFHEMGYDAPYYFAPAAEPFHEDITDWQRQFQTEIGLNNTTYFDAKGWLYYTRERFDLFYPSYGDTWPTFNGAIGMTYEQAGHGRAGTAVITSEGDTLTLAQRVLQQHTVGLSTVEVTSNNADRVVQEFKHYFDRAQSNPPGEYKTYIISGDNPPDRLRDFLTYLENQDIAFGPAPRTRRVDALNYATAQTERISLSENDIVISAYQPKSVMLKVLLEPQTAIIDSVTYDITAWSLPYAYGLKAFATSSRINPTSTGFEVPSEVGIHGAEEPYGYIAKWQSEHDARFLAAMLRHGIRVRTAEVPFRIDGQDYERGTLVITRRGNERFGDNFGALMLELAEKHERSLHAVSTGFVESGIDFGALDMKHIRPPRIAVLAGSGVASYNFGEIWHFFDQQIGYPANFIDVSNLNQVNWNDYDILILPNGNYNNAFNDDGKAELNRWVRAGGKIIAFENAARFVANIDGISGISIRRSEDAELTDEDKLRVFANREREAASGAVRGGIFKLNVDHTHPLGFGYDRPYFTLKNSPFVFDYFENGWNVFTLQEGSHRNGFVGYEVKDHIYNSLIFGVQPVQRGNVVILADNPLFRAFWNNGKMIFANAVFMVGN